MDWIKAHAKFIPPLIGAVLVFVLDEETAKEVAATAAAILTFLIPNSTASVDRIYHRK